MKRLLAVAAVAGVAVVAFLLGFAPSEALRDSGALVERIFGDLFDPQADAEAPAASTAALDAGAANASGLVLAVPQDTGANVPRVTGWDERRPHGGGSEQTSASPPVVLPAMGAEPPIGAMPGSTETFAGSSHASNPGVLGTLDLDVPRRGLHASGGASFPGPGVAGWLSGLAPGHGVKGDVATTIASDGHSQLDGTRSLDGAAFDTLDAGNAVADGMVLALGPDTSGNGPPFIPGPPSIPGDAPPFGAGPPSFDGSPGKSSAHASAPASVPNAPTALLVTLAFALVIWRTRRRRRVVAAPPR